MKLHASFHREAMVLQAPSPLCIPTGFLTLLTSRAALESQAHWGGTGPILEPCPFQVSTHTGQGTCLFFLLGACTPLSTGLRAAPMSWFADCVTPMSLDWPVCYPGSGMSCKRSARCCVGPQFPDLCGLEGIRLSRRHQKDAWCSV